MADPLDPTGSGLVPALGRLRLAASVVAALTALVSLPGLIGTLVSWSDGRGPAIVALSVIFGVLCALPVVGRLAERDRSEAVAVGMLAIGVAGGLYLLVDALYLISVVVDVLSGHVGAAAQDLFFGYVLTWFPAFVGAQVIVLIPGWPDWLLPQAAVARFAWDNRGPATRRLMRSRPPVRDRRRAVARGYRGRLAERTLSATTCWRGSPPAKTPRTSPACCEGCGRRPPKRCSSPRRSSATSTGQSSTSAGSFPKRRSRSRRRCGRSARLRHTGIPGLACRIRPSPARPPVLAGIGSPGRAQPDPREGSSASVHRRRWRRRHGRARRDDALTRVVAHLEECAAGDSAAERSFSAGMEGSAMISPSLINIVHGRPTVTSPTGCPGAYGSPDRLLDARPTGTAGRGGARTPARGLTKSHRPDRSATAEAFHAARRPEATAPTI